MICSAWLSSTVDATLCAPGLPLQERSSWARRLKAETWREAVRALTTLQRIDRGRGREDPEPDELRTELVANVHRLRGCLFQRQPDLRDRVIGPAPHSGGR